MLKSSVPVNAPPVWHLDGCPGCVSNTESPLDVTETSTGTIAHYRCADCGQEWSTAWMDR